MIMSIKLDRTNNCRPPAGFVKYQSLSRPILTSIKWNLFNQVIRIYLLHGNSDLSIAPESDLSVISNGGERSRGYSSHLSGK